MVRNVVYCMFLFPLVCYFAVKSILTQETALQPANHRHESNPWNRCTIDSKGRLGCECDLKGDGCPRSIVPNVVHYVMSQMSEISFAHLVSIRSVLRNQKPDKIIIHCTCSEITGHRWDKWFANETRIEVRTIPRLVHVFHQNISEQLFIVPYFRKKRNIEPWLAGDVLRLYVLLTSPEGGGIFLDNDVYVVSSLAKYLKYEMTLTRFKGYIGDQIIIAHRDARFLRFWLDTLDNRKFLKEWYFIAVNLERLLKKNPALDRLIHWVERIPDRKARDLLYYNASSEWRLNEVYHFFLRNNSIFQFHNKTRIILNETSTQTLTGSFGEMVKEVLWG